MKAILLAALALISCVHSCLAYGSITFANRYSSILAAPIYGPEQDWINYGGDWADAKTGNTANGIPPGSQTYAGELLSGAGWTVSFYAAPGIVTNGWLLEVGDVTTTFRTGSLAGYFYTRTVGFPNIPDFWTGPITAQVRVWNNLGGTVTSWWEAYSLSTWSIPGASALFSVSNFGITGDFRSFSLGWLDSNLTPPIVPEPSALTLIPVAAAAVLLLTRRR